MKIDARKLVLLSIGALLSISGLTSPLSASVGPGSNPAVCQFEAAPTVIETETSLLLQYWDFSDDSVATNHSLPSSRVLAEYLTAVRSKLDTEPRELLKRYLMAGPPPKEAHNVQEALQSTSVDIRPIRCIEALLLDNQIKRNPLMLAEPTEFIAFFLRHPAGPFRVYYLTNDINGVRRMGTLFDRVRADLKNGWVFSGNLHNHSFFLEHLHEDVIHHPQGVLAPSVNDMKVFLSLRKEMSLQSSSITNGFHTIDICSEAFDRFLSADD